MFDLPVLWLSMRQSMLKRTTTIRRWWKIVPYTTRDQDKRTWRKVWFKESVAHEWKILKLSPLFGFFSKKSSKDREISRMFYRMNHPHAGTRQLAECYRRYG